MHLSTLLDKHFGLKGLQTLKHLNLNKVKGELIKIKACCNPEVDDEGNQDRQWHDFLL